jgi:cell division septum initiation protein DivIVA
MIPIRQAAPKAPSAQTPGPAIANGAAPAAPSVTIAAPRTAAEVDALRAMRSELSKQINSAEGRRKDVAKQLLTATDAAKPGLEQRLAVLDNRIAQLEIDIAESGRQLTTSGALIAGTEAPRFQGLLSSGQVTGISIVFTVFVLAPLAAAYARRMLKRTSQPAAPSLSGTDAQRLERMEQAIDTIAIEIERISEGQRFVTQLMGDPSRTLKAAPMEPIKMPVKDAIPEAR